MMLNAYGVAQLLLLLLLLEGAFGKAPPDSHSSASFDSMSWRDSPNKSLATASLYKTMRGLGNGVGFTKT